MEQTLRSVVHAGYYKQKYLKEESANDEKKKSFADFYFRRNINKEEKL